MLFQKPFRSIVCAFVFLGANVQVDSQTVNDALGIHADYNVTFSNGGDWTVLTPTTPTYDAYSGTGGNWGNTGAVMQTPVASRSAVNQEFTMSITLEVPPGSPTPASYKRRGRMMWTSTLEEQYKSQDCFKFAVGLTTTQLAHYSLLQRFFPLA